MYIAEEPVVVVSKKLSPSIQMELDSEVERDIARSEKLYSKQKTPPSLLHLISWFRGISTGNLIFIDTT